MADKYSPQQIEAAVAALKDHREKPYISHQWEELVLRLSRDNDPGLREQMHHELETIMRNDPWLKVDLSRN